MNNQTVHTLIEQAYKFIQQDQLSVEDKQRITDDTILHFDKYISPGWLKYRKSVSTNAATIEWQSKGANCIGLNNEEFIDCLGGFGVFNFGYMNQEILDIVQKQLTHQCIHSQELLDPLRGYLAHLMAEITPGDLEKCFFTNGGTEAIEMAIKLARIASGASWFISTINGFHGKTMGALSMTGKDSYRQPYLPLIQQVSHVRYGDIDDLRNTIATLHDAGEKIAAIILEPIQGEAGIILPPKGYLKQVRALCDEFGIFLIVDEIQTGMGRTGNIWRCEFEDIVPDIMVYGKAFGGGIMPITGLICRPHLWVQQLIDNPWLLGSPTFGGNPLACASAIATIDYMLRHNIAQQFKEKGDYLLEKLFQLKARYAHIIKDIRGVGLMIGMEFNSHDEGYLFAKTLFEKGVLVAGTLVNAQCIRIEPAAVISYQQLDQVIERMEYALGKISA